MKKSLVVLALLSSLGAGLGYADNTKRIPSAKPLCTEGVCGKHTKKCSCYCSVLCGPRKIQPDDEPVYADKDAQGQEIPARCYCKQMDVDKHIENCIEGKEQEGEEVEGEMAVVEHE